MKLVWQKGLDTGVHDCSVKTIYLVILEFCKGRKKKSGDPFISSKYDIALLKLVAPVDYALHVIPICLPVDDNKLVGRLAVAKGYGLLDYDIKDHIQGNKIFI